MLRGVRTHNLKSIDLDVPRNQLTVITGVSGSGKSSLAFDTIFAEGQRQFIDSLSAYARRFFNQLPRPELDSIAGLQPTLCIDQKQSSANSRSTVGTVTEVYDYLRLLMARLGIVHCYACGTPIEQQSADAILQTLMQLPTGTRLMILAPMVRGRKGKHLDVLAEIRRSGLIRVRVDGEMLSLDDVPDLAVRKNHTLDAVVDRLVVKAENQSRISDAIAMAVRLTDGLVGVSTQAGSGTRERVQQSDAPEVWDERVLSTKYACPNCGISYAEVEPRIFSFNSHYGACPACEGTGLEKTDEELSKAEKSLIPAKVCQICNGQRLKPESLAVRLSGLSIAEISKLDLPSLLSWLDELQPAPDKAQIAGPIVREIRSRVDFLHRVGVSYLTLSRSADTLSGGELQRVRLATSIGSGLIGVCYVLDEPSIGLHPADNERLIGAIRNLQRQGNTVIVVEHDDAMMLAADVLVDMGPGAGEHGGQIVAIGSPDEVLSDENSLTGQYLSNRKSIPLPDQRRSINWKHALKIKNADLHNLQNVSLDIPLGVLICVTGPSGSGKSSLINDTLQVAVQTALNAGKKSIKLHADISGIGKLDKLIAIDQSPIGRTARSTPATYCGIWDQVRKVFASSRDAKLRGFNASRFSFNAGAGRCQTCQGQGAQKLEMNFLADVYVTCPMCNGRRFNRPTLSVRYRHKNVADVLDMSVAEAVVFFENFDKLLKLLRPLDQVGLGYVRLGQASTTLSGGESQRVKLASELARPATGKTLYILDEPTTGLHIDDVGKVIAVLNSLVDLGNTVIVIEHHMDVAKVADWIIDLGPGGGKLGGRIVAAGTPDEVAESEESLTAAPLWERLNVRRFAGVSPVKR